MMYLCNLLTTSIIEYQSDKEFVAYFGLRDQKRKILNIKII